MNIQWKMHWFYPYRPSKIVNVKNKTNNEKDLKCFKIVPKPIELYVVVKKLTFFALLCKTFSK